MEMKSTLATLVQIVRNTSSQHADISQRGNSLALPTKIRSPLKSEVKEMKRENKPLTHVIVKYNVGKCLNCYLKNL